MNDSIRRFLRHRAEVLSGGERYSDVTLYRAAEAVEAGKTLYDMPEIERRFSICQDCKHFTSGNCAKMNRGCSTRRFWFWALVGWKGRFAAECESWLIPHRQTQSAE